MISCEFDKYYFKKYGRVAGIDEAGRGPLAGPVVAAVVYLKQNITDLNDSKKLPSKKRKELYDKIIESAYIGVGISTPEEIDILNILNATKLAIKRAVNMLPFSVDFYIIDGKNLKFAENSLCIIKGDSKSCSIAAASIVAKVTRDKIMSSYSKIFKNYGFEKHMGYPTFEHKKMIRVHGPTPFHRLTFSGVIENLSDEILNRWLKEKVISLERYKAVLRRKEKLKKQGHLFIIERGDNK